MTLEAKTGISERPSFTWEFNNNEIIITPGQSSPKDILSELIRQAIGLARRWNRLTYNLYLNGTDLLGDKEIAEKYLKHIIFSDDGKIITSTPEDASNNTNILVAITKIPYQTPDKHFEYLPVGLCISRGNKDELVLQRNILDANYDPNHSSASLHVIQLADIELYLRRRKLHNVYLPS